MKTIFKWSTILPALFLLVGLGAIAVALAADLLGVGGQPGFGTNQYRLAFAGGLALLLGGFLSSSPGQQLIENYRQWINKTQQPVSASKVMILAVWFGLLAGLIEVSIQSIQILWLGGLLRGVSKHLAWMAPVGEAFFFCVLGLALLLMKRLWPRIISLHTIVFVYAILGVYGALSPIRVIFRTEIYARWILFAGLAVVVVRLAVVFADGFDVFVRRTAPWLVGCVLVLVVGTFGVLGLAEHRALSALPAGSAGRPNVLLIVLDTVRAQSLSLHGYERSTTPRLKQLAKRSVMFDQAISTAPWTVPSHASMFTGRYPHEVTANWTTPLDDTHRTLAEVLSQQGYHTAGFVANMHKAGHSYGFDRGFVHFEDYPISWQMIVDSSPLLRISARYIKKGLGIQQSLIRKSAADVNQEFLSWLPDQAKQPFFVFLNYYDAHDPYLPPKPFDTFFGTSKIHPLPSLWEDHYTKDEIQALLDVYDRCIASVDHYVGLLLDELDNRGVLENTIVIVTADHGEEFFEHRLMGHSNSLYRTLLHVPLLIAWPSHVPENQHVKIPISLRDLPATVLDLIGLADKHQFPGTSLSRYWVEGDTDIPDDNLLILSEVSQGINTPAHFPISRGSLRSLMTPSMHYIINSDGTEQLYEYTKDEWEQHNLMNTEEGAQTAKHLRDSLEAMLSKE